MISSLPKYKEILEALYTIVNNTATSKSVKAYGYFPRFDDVKGLKAYVVCGASNIPSEFNSKTCDGYVLSYSIHIWSFNKTYIENVDFISELMNNNITLNNRQSDLNVLYSEIVEVRHITEDDNITHSVMTINYYVMA